MGKPKGRYIHPDNKQAKRMREESRRKHNQPWYQTDSQKMRDFLRGKR